MVDCQDKDMRVQCERRLKVKFLGSQVTIDARLSAYHEHDETFGLTEMAPDELEDSRVGHNNQHGLLSVDLQPTCGLRRRERRRAAIGRSSHVSCGWR